MSSSGRLTSSLPSLEGRRILVTGATGAVAAPLVRALAPANQVSALARFRDPDALRAFESLGVATLPFDLSADRFDAIPDAFDVVLHFAVDRATGGSFDRELTASSEATVLLMQRCTSASAFLQCSSNAVYQPNGGRPVDEAAPLGDSHRSHYPTYSIGRIAAEAAARSGSRAFSVPTVIARLNVPYGSVWGWPARHARQLLAGEPIAVHPTDDRFSPIHEDDLVGQIGAIVGAASVPATVVNWAGDDAASVREWCDVLAAELGVPARYAVAPNAFAGANADVTRRRIITGPATVGWRDGMRRLAAAIAAASPPTN